MMEPHSLCRIENLSGGYPYRVSYVGSYLNHSSEIFSWEKPSTFLCLMFGASQQSIPVLFCGVEDGVDFDFSTVIKAILGFAVLLF